METLVGRGFYTGAFLQQQNYNKNRNIYMHEVDNIRVKIDTASSYKVEDMS